MPSVKNSFLASGELRSLRVDSGITLGLLILPHHASSEMRCAGSKHWMRKFNKTGSASDALC